MCCSTAFALYIVLLTLISSTSAATFGPSFSQNEAVDGGCVVQSYIIRSDVHLRYATTLLRVHVTNPSRQNHATRCLHRVVVPEAAFVSSVFIEVGNRVLKSVVIVRDDEDDQGQTESTKYIDDLFQHKTFRIPRDSKLLQVKVALAPHENGTIYITYEQLLSRRLGIYEVVLNLHPGQVVPELIAEARLFESHEFVVVRVPSLRTGHEIDPLEVRSEFPLAKVRRLSILEAHVVFAPTREQQLQMVNSRSWTNDPRSPSRNEGVSGQLIVQFDLIRTRDGEITIHDNFFAHHYAPSALSVLPKHVVFVLDLSSSMAGRKIQQLKTAMVAILDELRKGDFFSIIQFNSFKSVWSPDGKSKKKKSKNYRMNKVQAEVMRVIPATRRYIGKAKKYISQLKAMGGTNIQRPLVKALDIAHTGTSPLSLVVLLTDGETTVGESKPARILQALRTANKISNSTRYVPIYSLAFGAEADFPFLRHLSGENFGFSRRIYNAEDAALQLHEVFAELSSPVLANLTFKYPDSMIKPESLTQHHFAAAYVGSELVVAGRLENNAKPVETPNGKSRMEMWGEVQGCDVTGTKTTVHLPYVPDVPMTSQILLPPLSRLWAYLTVQQLLLGSSSSPDSRQKATELALEYSFVTATTTLSLRTPDDQTPSDNKVTLLLPKNQEIGSEIRERGGLDACSEGGAGEYWLPVLRIFIPCTSVPPQIKSPPSRNHQMTSSRSFTEGSSFENEERTRSIELTTFDKLRWLPDKRYEGRYLVLPKGRAGADQLFRLGLNQTTNVAYAECFSPINTPSHCRHLHFCPLKEFADNYKHFLNFFCAIHDFVGVCCPDSLFPYQETFH